MLGLCLTQAGIISKIILQSSVGAKEGCFDVLFFPSPDNPYLSMLLPHAAHLGSFFFLLFLNELTQPFL